MNDNFEKTTEQAAAFQKIPTIIHEQNAVMGHANKLLAPRVTAIATSFAGVLAGEPVLVIGTHFAGPTAGHVVRDGKTFRLVV